MKFKAVIKSFTSGRNSWIDGPILDISFLHTANKKFIISKIKKNVRHLLNTLILFNNMTQLISFN